MTTETEHPGSSFWKIHAGVRQRVEFGDALLFLYTLVLARQCFWIVGNNILAWALSIALAGACWYLYISTKQFQAERFGRGFWLLVGLPLLGFYLLRAAFPDRSYDVLAYHLLHTERTLRGALYGPGDFFPTALPFNPAADTLTGISRLLLGFRLGTVINLLALVWTAQVVDKILRPFIGRAWLRSACVLLVVLSESLLFEISTYMVDLLTLPLMLEATLLTLRADEAKNRRANFIHVAVLLGSAAAFKLTNLGVAIPVLAVCFYKLAVGPRRLTLKPLVTTVMLALGAFLAPILPFTLYIFRLTGNPVFPAANTFFQSPYWPTHGGWDNRWGPQTFWETIAWPVLVAFRPERYSELGVYSGRLSFGCVVALAGLVLVWRNERVRTLCIVLLSSSLLWSATALGYSRYGLYGDVLGGLTVFAVSCALTAKISWAKISWRTALASVFCVMLVVQACFACSYVLRKEWGSRTTVVADPDIYVHEATQMLRDRSLRSFLTDRESALFDGVQVWLETCPTSTGVEVSLKPRAPIIAVRQAEYFVTRESWRRFIRVIEDSPQGMFSLCLNADLPTAKEAIVQRGLEIGKVTPIQIPFFSLHNRIGMMLIEVRIPQEPGARSEFESAWMKSAFPTSDYREEIVGLDAPSVMHPGQRVDIQFRVKNLGNATWPAVGTKDFRYQVNMGNRWIVTGGTVVEDNRAVMKSDLPPGGETLITLTVNAPRTPGEYTLQIDMVHEGVTWFSEKGGRPLRLGVRVEP